jgi:hypothetical protein
VPDSHPKRAREHAPTSSVGVLMMLAAAAPLTAAACFASETCDTAPYYRCVDGMIYVGGCTGTEAIIGQCAQGCAADSMYANHSGCAYAVCRENEPKKAGDACQSETDCAPTDATVSTFAVTNTYLTCDAATHACVTTAPPAVSDWLAACDGALIADLQSQDEWFDNAVQDPSCAEGWCAVLRNGTTGCVANACTRRCTGDQDCPLGATCHYAEIAGCDYLPEPAYCKPGGPMAIGFTCP